MNCLVMLVSFPCSFHVIQNPVSPKNDNFELTLYTSTCIIVGRRVLTPLFYEDPPILPTPPFSNFIQPHPLSCRLQPPPPSVALFLWLNGWSRHIWCTILLNEIMVIIMDYYDITISWSTYVEPSTRRSLMCLMQ